LPKNPLFLALISRRARPPSCSGRHLLLGDKRRVRRTSVPGPEKATVDTIDLGNNYTRNQKDTEPELNHAMHS